MQNHQETKQRSTFPSWQFRDPINVPVQENEQYSNQDQEQKRNQDSSQNCCQVGVSWRRKFWPPALKCTAKELGKLQCWSSIQICMTNSTPWSMTTYFFYLFYFITCSRVCICVIGCCWCCCHGRYCCRCCCRDSCWICRYLSRLLVGLSGGDSCG